MGTGIHNIELKPGNGGQLARCAGTSAQLIAKEGDVAHLRLPSSEVRKVSIDCRATIGQLSNVENETVSIGKAGRSRWLGRRPQSRGVVMNPVDHPHGGGEGKAPKVTLIRSLRGVNRQRVLRPAVAVNIPIK